MLYLSSDSHAGAVRRKRRARQRSNYAARGKPQKQHPRRYCIYAIISFTPHVCEDLAIGDITLHHSQRVQQKQDISKKECFTHVVAERYYLCGGLAIVFVYP